MLERGVIISTVPWAFAVCRYILAFELDWTINTKNLNDPAQFWLRIWSWSIPILLMNSPCLVYAFNSGCFSLGDLFWLLPFSLVWEWLVCGVIVFVVACARECNCAGGNFLEPSGTVYTYCCLSNIFTRVWKIFWETFFGLPGRSDLHMLFVDEASRVQKCLSGHAYGKVRKMPSERCRCIFFSEFFEFRLFFTRVWKIVTPKSWAQSSLGF